MRPHGLPILLSSLMFAGVAGCEVRFESGSSDTADEMEESRSAQVPARPVSGSVRGRRFAYEEASIEEGILKLRQGEEFFADLEVTLFLMLDNDSVVPEGKTWNVECRDGWTAGVPHVHIGWRDEGEKLPEHDQAVCGYRLYLDFGHETDQKTLPGELMLESSALETEIAGQFEADIKGFRIKDGRVDLTQDDLDVAHHLARLWLAEKRGGPIEVEDHSLAWLQMESPDGGPQEGYSVYWWRPEGGDDTRISKLQFAKRDGSWRVERELEVWQVGRAHPLSPGADLMESLDRRAAKRFEEEHLAERGSEPVFVTEVRSSYNPKVGLAEVKLRYLLDPERAREAGGLLGGEEHTSLVRYLFRTRADYPAYNEPEAWTLERRLRDGEEVDYREGRVVSG